MDREYVANETQFEKPIVPGALTFSVSEGLTLLTGILNRTGMAFLGAGLALCMPAISAGASLAVTPEEQGAAAGLVSSCPAIGFSVGPICAGALYQVHGPLAPLFSAAVFFAVLLILVINDR